MMVSGRMGYLMEKEKLTMIMEHTSKAILKTVLPIVRTVLLFIQMEHIIEDKLEIPNQMDKEYSSIEIIR